ncbi:hypothetical protein LLB_3593 [Legionella longbeachae D-4968]|nr:hypothetical protein LLB_3593 [Legionella longbeachae D-4968]
MFVGGTIYKTSTYSQFYYGLEFERITVGNSKIIEILL